MLSQNETSDKGCEKGRLITDVPGISRSKPSTWEPLAVGWSSVDIWKETAEISAHCAASNIKMTLRMRQIQPR